ncbi:hypothetical protein [Corynebacterium sp.]|uniref:hypothetical protein n=1 Tax=Corynebacterium sp. TaxID=1720 RepID=UPI0026DCCE26|nr:hypothetical protein [Corynebacterium sp.]MDO5032653.1 hypothetical protein [Corynebacterium sp.]
MNNDELFADALRRLNIAERALHDARVRFEAYARHASAPSMATVPPISQPAEQARQAEQVQPAEQARPTQQAQPAQPVRTHAPQPPLPPLRPTPPPAAPKKQPRDAEKTLIGFVAVGGSIITLVGVAFLVGLAIQAGLLGPVGRVVLAYLAGAAFFGGVLAFRGKAHPAGATALLVTSLLTMMTTTHIVVVTLGWWPPLLGALLLTAFYAAFVFFVDKQPRGLHSTTQLWLASGMLFFGLFYPLFAESGSAPILLMPLVAVAYDTWRSNENLRAVGAGGVFLTVLAFLVSEEPILPSLFQVLVASLLAVCLAALVVFMPAVREPQQDGNIEDVAKDQQRAGEGEELVGDMMTGFVVPIVLLVAAAMGAGSILEYWLIVAAIVMIAGVAWDDIVGRTALAAAPIAFSLCALDAYWGWTEEAPKEPFRLASWVGLNLLFFIAAVALLPYLRRFWVQAAWGFAVIMLTSSLALATLLEPMGTGESVALAQAPILGCALVAAWLLRSRIYGNGDGRWVGVAVIFALYLSMLAVVGLVAGLFGRYSSEAMLMSAYFAAHALVSVAWMVLAARLLLSSYSHGTKIGVLLAVVAVSKLTFFDLAATSGIFRALAFLVSGIVLLTIAVRRTSGASGGEARD